MVGQILEEVMQKNDLEKEMVDAGQFIDQLLDRLFADGIVENPFDTYCMLHANTLKEYLIKEIISKPKSGVLIGQMKFDESLIYGSFFVT